MVPKVGLYVTKADKATLDELPEGVTGAAILREALASWRRHGEECPHPDLMVICPDCGYRAQAPSGDEDPVKTRSSSDGDTGRSRRTKPQASHV